MMTSLDVTKLRKSDFKEFKSHFMSISLQPFSKTLRIMQPKIVFFGGFGFFAALLRVPAGVCIHESPVDR